MTMTDADESALPEGVAVVLLEFGAPGAPPRGAAAALARSLARSPWAAGIFAALGEGLFKVVRTQEGRFDAVVRGMMHTFVARRCRGLRPRDVEGEKGDGGRAGRARANAAVGRRIPLTDDEVGAA